MIHKLLRLYKSLAIIVLTTCVLLFLVNSFFFFLTKIRWKYLPHFNPIYASYGDTLQMVYPDLAKTEMHNLLAETWGRAYEYQQYTQFGERPYKGKYVNVDKNGFRFSKNQGPWPPSSNNYSVFIFGGSTTFNYGVSDNETIASYLQEFLNAPSLEKPIKVYNFGRGHYNSTQERILFESLLFKGLEVDMAIFIDGVNEMGNNGPLMFTSRLKKVFDREGLFLDFVRQTAIGRACFAFLRYFNIKFGRKLGGKQTKTDAGQLICAPNSEEISYYDAIFDHYVVNKKITEAVGKAFGVKTVFIWQPAPGYKYDLKYHLFAWGRPDLMSHQSRFYPHVRKVIENRVLGDNSFWLADIQEKEKRPLYVDSVHYSAYMSRKLARAIYDCLSNHDWTSMEHASSTLEEDYEPKQMSKKTQK